MHNNNKKRGSNRTTSGTEKGVTTPGTSFIPSKGTMVGIHHPIQSREIRKGTDIEADRSHSREVDHIPNNLLQGTVINKGKARILGRKTGIDITQDQGTVGRIHHPTHKKENGKGTDHIHDREIETDLPQGDLMTDPPPIIRMAENPTLNTSTKQTDLTPRPKRTETGTLTLRETLPTPTLILLDSRILTPLMTREAHRDKGMHFVGKMPTKDMIRVLLAPEHPVDLGTLNETQS